MRGHRQAAGTDRGLTGQHSEPTEQFEQSQAGHPPREGVPLSVSRRYYPPGYGLPQTVEYWKIQPHNKRKASRPDRERERKNEQATKAEKLPHSASRKVFVRGAEEGLSKGHKWEMAIGGELLRVVGCPVSLPSKLRSHRGQVSKFTRKSRQRLLRKARSVDQGLTDLPTCVDLTYPGKLELVPTDGRTVKAHLRKFFDRLEYRFPEVSALWVEEFQGRGAAHLHLMVYGLPPRLQMAFKLWVSRSWWKIAGHGDPDHLKAGTKVKRVESWRQAVGYLSAYAGKVEQKTVPAGFTHMGRFWGVMGRKRWCHTKASGVLPASGFFTIKRVLRKWLQRRTGRRYRFDDWWKGYTVYIGSRAGFKLLAWCGAFADGGNGDG